MGKSISKAKFRILPMLGAMLLGACATREAGIVGDRTANLAGPAAAKTEPVAESGGAGVGQQRLEPPQPETPRVNAPISAASADSPRSLPPSAFFQTPGRSAPRPRTPADLVTRGKLVKSGSNTWLFEKNPGTPAGTRRASEATGQFQQAAALSRARADFALDAHRTGRDAPVLSTRQGIFVVEMPPGSTPGEGARAVDSLLSLPGVSSVRLVSPASGFANP